MKLLRNRRRPRNRRRGSHRRSRRRLGIAFALWTDRRSRAGRPRHPGSGPDARGRARRRPRGGRLRGRARRRAADARQSRCSRRRAARSSRLRTTHRSTTASSSSPRAAKLSDATRSEVEALLDAPAPNGGSATTLTALAEHYAERVCEQFGVSLAGLRSPRLRERRDARGRSRAFSSGSART